MLLSNGVLLQQSGLAADVVAAGLVHDWKFDSDTTIVDRVSGINPTMYGGQALEFSGLTANFGIVYDTNAGDYQMAFINSKATASIGATFRPDSVHNGHLIGGWYGSATSGLPLSTRWRDESGVAYIELGFYKTPLTWTQCFYRVAGGSAGSWRRVWWQLDSSQTTHLGTSGGIPARVRCWVDGSEVNVSAYSGGTFDQGDLLTAHATVARNRLSIGAGSEDAVHPVTDSAKIKTPFDGLIQRGFVTSNLVSRADAETLLTGHPYQFPTLTDGHIYVLDEGTGTVATDYRDGSSTITAAHAGALPIDTAWQNGGRQQTPCPQTILRRHGAGGHGASGGNSALVYNGAAYTTAGWSLPAAPLTIEVWLRQPSATGVISRLCYLRDASSPYYGVAFFADAANAHIYAFTDTPAGGEVGLFCYAASHNGEWIHFVCRSNGTALYGYFAKASASVFTATTPASVAGAAALTTANQSVRFLAHSSGDRARLGSVGRCLIYNRELTDAELLVNHKAMRSQYV